MLASFLASPHLTRENVGLALKAYNEARVQESGRVSLRSRAQGLTYALRQPNVGKDPKKISEFMDKLSSEIVSWNVDDHVKEGLQWIEVEAKPPTNGHL